MILKPKQNTSGLTRIVMINSGQADYVEIEPHSSVHLVGDNGIGKSMILATIQFLLIDDWTIGKMKMSKGALKHKEFYFPNSKSYILFELESIEGIRHLYLMRGLGKTNRYEIEKWAAEGCWYNEELFIKRTEEGSKVLAWDEVKRNLISSASSLEKISNKQDRIRTLKSWLGWYDKSKSEEDFSKLYLQFLKLSSIKEHSLKQQIIASAVPENFTKRIDISEKYSQIWREIVNEKANLEKLRKVEIKLGKTIQSFEDLTTRKSALISRFSQLNIPLSEWHTNAKINLENFQKKGIETKKESQEIKIEIEDIRKLEKRSNDRLIELNLTAKEELKKESFATKFDAESAEISKDSMQTELESIMARIGSSKKLSLDKLQQKLRKFQTEKSKKERFVEDQSSTLFSALKNSGIENSSIKKAFRILNDEILLAEGKVSEIESAKSWVQRLADSISEDTVEINGLIFQLNSEIPELPDLDSIILQIKDIEAEISEIIDQIEIQKNLAPILAEKEKIERHLFGIKKDIEKYELWISSGKDKFESLKEEQIQVKGQYELYSSEAKRLDNRSKELKAILTDLAQKIEHLSLTDTIIENYRECGKCLKLDSIPEDSIQSSVTDVVVEAKRLHTDCQSFERDYQKFEINLLKIQNNLGGVFSEIQTEEFIDEARVKLAGIDKIEQHVQNLWTELSNNISGTAESLTKSLREVDRKVSSINTILKKKKITNLDEIHIGIDKNDTKVKSIIRAASTSVLHNFEESQNKTHFGEMEKLFEEKPSIELIDLFNLQISIRKPGETERSKIGSIDVSGSEGTITAIKSHLLMILISDLLGKNRSRIPIFLDETGTLGSSNYKQILDMAREMDIQILTASPTAVEHAERQHAIVGYGLKKRLRIKPEQYWGEITKEESE